MNGKDIVARPGPGAGASAASPARVGVPSVILASLAPYLGRRAYREGFVRADSCCTDVAGSELLGSRLWGLWRAEGVSRGAGAGVVDRRAVSWVVLGITLGVNYPWIATESTLGFGDRCRSGIWDPCQGFPGLRLHQCGVRSPSREVPSLEATKGRVRARVSQSTSEHVEVGVRSWLAGSILPWALAGATL